MKRVYKIEKFCIVVLFLFPLLSIYACYPLSDTLDIAPKESFTIAVMSDTQLYSEIIVNLKSENEKRLKNDVFDSQTQWIIDNIEEQNIVFVSHAGDVVDRNHESQWDVAIKYLNRLHGEIPYGISLGNHDMTLQGNTHLFQKYFPSSRFELFDWYCGSFENNTNSYQLISSNGIDMIILHIECNAPDRVLDWANSVLEDYSNRLAIISTHMFLGPEELPVHDLDYFDKPKGIMKWHKTFGEEGNSPQQLWDKCFKKHENVKMILCGDQSRTNALYDKYIGEHGNIVHVMLSDYGINNGGGLRLYRFSPSDNSLKVITYNTIKESVIMNTDIVPNSEEHYFTITGFFKNHLREI